MAEWLNCSIAKWLPAERMIRLKKQFNNSTIQQSSSFKPGTRMRQSACFGYGSVFSPGGDAGLCESGRLPCIPGRRRIGKKAGEPLPNVIKEDLRISCPDL
jgi:hypothetical protein